MTPCEVAVFAVISAVPEEAGTEMQAIAEHLRREYGCGQVGDAVYALLEAGWIYSTVNGHTYLPVECYERFTRSTVRFTLDM